MGSDGGSARLRGKERFDPFFDAANVLEACAVIE
jgi:hypothetical protein